MLNKRILMLFILMFVVLYFQYTTTKPVSLTTLNEVERIEQLKRMNEYPRAYARLSNILEARKEMVLYYKLENNFTRIFDLNYFFGGLWKPLLVPFFIVGLFELIRRYPKEVLILALPPVVLTTLIGSEAYYGLVGFYPLLIISTLSGFSPIFTLRKVNEK